MCVCVLAAAEASLSGCLCVAPAVSRAEPEVTSSMALRSTAACLPWERKQPAQSGLQQMREYVEMTPCSLSFHILLPSGSA